MHVVNDADAAGLAEVRYGAATGRSGLVSSPPSAPASARPWCTTACWCRTPSSATSRSTATTPRSGPPTASARAEDLSWEKWAERLTTYYRTLEKLFSPDLFVVGGGVSKKADQFLPLLDLDTEIVPATLLNQAGIVGAALYAVRGRPADLAERRRPQPGAGEGGAGPGRRLSRARGSPRRRPSARRGGRRSG